MEATTNTKRAAIVKDHLKSIGQSMSQYKLLLLSLKIAQKMCKMVPEDAMGVHEWSWARAIGGKTGMRNASFWRPKVRI